MYRKLRCRLCHHFEIIYLQRRRKHTRNVTNLLNILKISCKSTNNSVLNYIYISSYDSARMHSWRNATCIRFKLAFRFILYDYVEVGSRFTSVRRKGTGNFVQRFKCAQKPQKIRNVKFVTDILHHPTEKRDFGIYFNFKCLCYLKYH